MRPNARIDISIQAYVDDIKLYSNSKEGLDKLIATLIVQSRVCGLELGLPKCAIATNQINPPPRTDGIQYLGNGPDDFYMYLGVPQGITSRPDLTMEQSKEKILKQMKLILKQDLRSDQLLRAIRTMIVPIIEYRYKTGVMSNSSKHHPRRFRSDVAAAVKLDKSLRVQMCIKGLRQTNLSKARPYLPKADGGLALPSVEDALYKSVLSTCCYLALGPGDMNVAMPIIQKATCRTVFTDAQKVADLLEVKITFKRGEVVIGDQRYTRLTHANQACARLVAKTQRESRLEELHSLPRAGKAMRTYESLIPSMGEVLNSRLSARMLRTVMAIHEDAVLTNAHPHNTGEAAATCRLGCGYPETIKHILGGCTGQGKFNQLVKRHDNMLIPLIKLIQAHIKCPITPLGQTPEPTFKSPKYALEWNPKYTTFEHCFHNNPDAVFQLIEERLIIIIEGAVCHHTLLQERPGKKNDKYFKGDCGHYPCLCHEIYEENSYTSSLKYNLEKLYPGYRVEVVTMTMGTGGEHDSTTNKDLTDTLIRHKIATSSQIKEMYRAAAQTTACNSATIISKHLAHPTIRPERENTQN